MPGPLLHKQTDKRVGINKNGSHRQGPAVCDFPRHWKHDLVPYMRVTVAFGVSMLVECFNNVLC